MYSVIPKRQNKLNALACLVCFVCGVGVFAVSMISLSVPYLKLLAQLFGVLLLTAGVYLYGKFVARVYAYTVQPGGIFDADGYELYDLVVTETVGKRRQRVVCRLSLRDIAWVHARPAQASKKNGLAKIRANHDGGRVFSYCVDLVPQKVITVGDADGNVVVLTFDARLYEILSQKV